MITPAMIATATLYLRFTYAICLIVVIVGTVFAVRRKMKRIRRYIDDRKATKRRRASSVEPSATAE